MVSTPKNPRFNLFRGSNSSAALGISRPRVSSLFDAEKNASRNLSQFNPQQYRRRESLASELDDALTAARTGESTASDYANNVTGPKSHSKDAKAKKKGLRRFGPLAIIIAMLFGGGTFFMLSFSTLGPQLSAVITEATDVQYPSYNLRNQRLLKYMMGDVRISNFTRKYTNFSPWLKSRLAKNGIEVGKIDADGNFVKGSTISTSSTVLKYGDDIISANDFQTRFASDVNFREAYYKAKRGRIAGYFDDAADRFYTKKNQTRDIFSRYTSTGDDQKDRSNFEDVVNEHLGGSDTTVQSGAKVRNEETGEDELIKNGSGVNSGHVAGDTPEVKARAFVNSLAGVVDNVGVPVCSALRIVNIASLAAMAYQIAQSASYFLSFLEPINKAMAGDGDEASAHTALNFLTETTDSEVTYVDENGVTQTKTITGSPMDSYGARLIMSNTAVSPSDTDPFGINALTRSAKRVALTTGASTTTCQGVQAASAIVSLASVAIPGGSLVKVAISVVARTVGGIVLTGIIAAIIEAIIPQLTKMFISDAFEYYTGIPGGEFLFEGATHSNYGLATEGSASMPASKSRVARQNYESTLALAQEAEVDRLTHSQFDATNPNTFLGSIVRQFSAMSFSTSIMNGFTAFSSTVHNSFSSILSGAYADEVGSLKYTATTQECEFLEGAVCDIYGTPIPAADFSTVDIAPDDPTYEAIISQNLDFSGSAKNNVTAVSDDEEKEGMPTSITKNFEDYKIRDDSELAKFITFCVNRESPWGYTDANILGSLQSGNTVLNSMPIANDLLDILNAYEDSQNMGWATGEVCMNSENNPRWDNEFKYYQRYVEDMRILGTMSDEEGDANPVIAFEKAYAETHPVDTSFEGTLARISGLTRDDVAFLLEVIDYSNQLAQYDPTTRYGYVGTEEKTYEIPEKSIFATIADFVTITPNTINVAYTREAATSC